MTNLTDSQLLKLARDAYNDNPDYSTFDSEGVITHEGLVPEGFEEVYIDLNKLDENDNRIYDSAFKARSYYNSNTNELIIAPAGTNDLIDLMVNDPGYVAGYLIPQFDDADRYYNAVLEKVNNDFGQGLEIVNQDNITLTGHSHGDGLASMLGVYKGVSVVGFNGPGISRQLDNIEKYDDIRDKNTGELISEGAIETGDLTSRDPESFTNIRHVVLKGDFVHLAGEQVGLVEELDANNTILGTTITTIIGAASGALLAGPIGAVGGIVGGLFTKYFSNGIREHLGSTMQEAIDNKTAPQTTFEKFLDTVGSIDSYFNQATSSVVDLVNNGIDWLSSGNVISDLTGVAKDAWNGTVDFLGGLFGGNDGSAPTNADGTINTDLIDNSSLDFQVNIDENSNNATADPNDALTGTVIPGGDYAASIPEDIANVDDYSNAQLTKIASDDLRIANDELADNSVDNILDKTMNFIQDTFVEPVSNLASNIWSGVTSAFSTITNLFTEAPKVQNVDPLILDLNNNGVELIHFDNSIVSFDVDNDGYKENTGWVDGNDGILVHDKNADGVINDITETISEYYNANDNSILIDDQNRYFADGLEALKALDSNNDNIFNNQDDLWNTLRVWQDENEDGLTNEGEIKTLEEHNIESIDLNRQISYRERLEGNPVLSRSNMTMTDGTTREVAAVDFATNPIGYEWNDVYEQGSKITTEDGQSSSFVVTGQTGQTVDLANEGVNSAYGNIGDDTLIGDANDNWLMGGLGSDTLIGGAGDDVIMIDAEDLNENIDGGEGMDVVKVTGDDSITFNMGQSNVEVLNSGGGDDILLSGGIKNAFISGGAGDDIIIGGAADDALSGEDGNDMIDGGYGDDIIRGHRGEDLLIGGKGNDLLEGGLGDDDLRGGEGSDIFMGGGGDDIMDGGEGFDMVEYKGKYDQYSYITEEDGTIKVTNTKDGSVDTITNVERLRFDNVDINLGDANSLPLPVKDNIVVDDSGQFILDQSQILANDFSTSGKSFSVREVSDAVGGTVELREDGKIVFTPDPYFTGTMSFDYSVVDEDGLYATISRENSDGVVESVNLKAQVNLVNESDPDDPLYYDQWYLSEIRIKTAWEDYSGQGINVGIFEGDYGNPFNHEHADLNDNISDYYLNNVLYEEDVEGFSNHATLVAGVIAAEKNNEGSIGIAYNSEIASFSWTPDVDGLDNLINYDVANNSWGYDAPFADDFLKDQGGFVYFEEISRGIESATQYGRDGLGTSIIFAGGNSRAQGDNVNYHNIQNSRFVSTIGSINQEGDLSKLIEASDPFSNPGSAILVSAPGSNIKSTANLLENENGSTFGDDFETSQGTSFSAPITSGVVALMLEANPYLAYRDVQEILAKTARIVDDENTVWLKNGDVTVNDGSGMHYSEDYGFGIIDAHSAIRVAEMWHEINNSINEEVVEATTSQSQNIADNSEITSTININSDINIEHAEIYVDIDHTRISDLVLTLVSPDGTESLLVNNPGQPLDEGESTLSPDQDGLKFRLSTTNNYGENGTGDWILKVKDTATGETGILNSWELKLYGKKDNGNDDYIFTDEFGLSNGRTINDGSGNDSINAVSILTDSTINLNSGTDSNIAGKTVHIDSNTKIEEAYSGDGNDTLIGNELDNVLYGGRGNNNLTGNAGADKFVIFKATNQTDTITDFNVAESGEKIDLTRFKFDSFSDIIIQQQGNDAVVDLGNGQSLILQNVDAASLSQNNFTGFLDEQVTLNGSSGRDNLYGDERDNIINAGDSDDYISGGKGNNIISGGQGSDIFFISQNPRKTDTITDFDVNDINERISLRNFKEIKNIDDLTITQEDNNAVILLDSGQKIVLDNTDKNELDNKNFIFFGQTLGTDADNRIVGSDFPDLIDGGDGNDIIRGLEWDDNIYGGKGDDVLRGDHGDDKLYGGDGNDTLVGGVGGDDIYGGKGNDLISGGHNIDGEEYGDDKQNRIYGEEGDDNIYGDKGNDYLSGGDGSDYLSGRKGDDELHGGNDDDRLYGGEGSDLIYGGQGSDIINGDSYIDINTNTIIDTDTAENGDDVIYGENGNDYIFAKGGNDTIYGGNDDDYIDGGKGDDEIYGEAGNDTIILSSGNDTVDGGSGSNTFVLERNTDSVTTINNFNTEFDKIDLNSYDSEVELGNFNIAQDGNNTLITFRDNQIIKLTNIDSATLSFDNFVSDLFSFLSDNVNSINGTANADYIVGGNNLDTINGLDGNDTIYGNDGDDFLHGGNGDDKLYGGNGDDSLYGNGTRDLATLEVVNHDTNTGNNQLYGGAGDDVLLGGSGNDYLDGGEGHDIIFGEGGNDIIIAGSSAQIQAGSGDDIIVAGDYGASFLWGESGLDTFKISLKDADYYIDYDVIYDFELNEIIDLSEIASVQKFSDINVYQQTNGDTYLNFAGQTLILSDFDANNINASHFVFKNITPVVASEVQEQIAETTTEFSFQIPNNIFSDANEDSLTYNVTLNDGSDLPSWLTFDNNTLTLSGTPNNEDIGELLIKVTASDGEYEASTNFSLSINRFNNVPVATIISASTDEDNNVTIDVLAGASDVDGDILSISNITDPQNGTAQIVDGKIIYTPDADYNGSDSFSYTILDDKGASVTKDLIVNINPTNDDPVARTDVVITAEEQEIFINPLEKASDVDGDTIILSEIEQPQNGVAEIIDGQVKYTPNQGFKGQDIITYTISDGNGGFDTKNIAILVDSSLADSSSSNKVVGTDNNDYLEVSTSGNIILGLDGDDFITNYSGDNKIYGGDGNNIMVDRSSKYSDGANTFIISEESGSRDTIVNFSYGVDKIDLSNFNIDINEIKIFELEPEQYFGNIIIKLPNDQLINIRPDQSGGVVGIQKSDFIVNGDFDLINADTLFDKIEVGEAGFIEAGNKSSLIYDNFSASNTLVGSEQDDLISVLYGDDVIDAKGGNDIIYVGRGSKEITGGDGQDTFILYNKRWSNDTITDYNPNEDIIDFSFDWYGLDRNFNGHNNIFLVEQDNDLVFYFDDDNVYDDHTVTLSNINYSQLNFDNIVGLEESNVTLINSADFVLEPVEGDLGSKSYIIEEKYWGNYVINDFDITKDKVDLSQIGNRQYNIQDLIQLNITNQNGDAVIDFGLGEQKVILKGIDASLLDISHFIGISDDSKTTEDVYKDGYSVAVGGLGEDILIADTFESQLYGHDGDDILLSGMHTTMYGGDGNDLLIDTTQISSELTGGAGNDIFKFVDKPGYSFSSDDRDPVITDFTISEDKIDLSFFADNFSKISFEQKDSDVLITVLDTEFKLLLKNINKDDISESNFIFTESSGWGSNFDETIIGSYIRDALVGYGGDDILQGGEGKDFLDGGSGNDIIDGGDGNDIIKGGEGNNILTGGLGNDEYIINNDWAIDVITDFSFSEDALTISSWLTDRGVIIEEKDSDLYLYLDNQITVLENRSYESINFASLGIDEGDVVLEKFSQINSSGQINVGFGNNIITPDIVGNNTYKIDDKYWGEDIINNFDIITDKIDLTQISSYYNEYNIADLVQLNIQNQNGDTIIDFGKGYQKIILKGINASDLTISNFVGITDNTKSTEDLNLTTSDEAPIVFGGLGNDTLIAAADYKDDQLYGYDGNDSLSNGFEINNTLLEGGSGNDTFIINDKFNHPGLIYSGTGVIDTITDFNYLEDTIDLSNIRDFSLESSEILQSGDDLILTIGQNQKLTLKNVNRDQILEDNLVLFEPTVINGSGDIFSSESDSIVIGSDLSDSMSIYGDNNVINAKGEDDTIYFGGNNNEIDAGDGNDLISFYANNQTNNSITGGQGSDIFSFQYGSHQDGDIINWVEDFETGNYLEKIDLRTVQEIKQFSDLNIYQEGNDSVIAINDNNKIVLRNTNVGDLDGDNFMFYSSHYVGSELNDEIYLYQTPSYNSPNTSSDIVNLEGKGGDDKLYSPYYGDNEYILDGGDGNDELYSMSGSATLIGGTGDDKFVIDDFDDPYAYPPQDGVITTQTINDFEADNLNEKIIMNSMNVTSFSDLIISQQGDDVLVELTAGGNQIILKNTLISDLSADNFEVNFSESNPNSGYSGQFAVVDGKMEGTEAGEFMSSSYPYGDYASEIYGLGGDDNIQSQGYEINIFAGSGNDTVMFNDYSYPGMPTTEIEKSATYFYGEDGNDDLVHYSDNAYENIMDGGAGDDIFSIYDGSPTLIGGSGNDLFDIKKNPDSTITIEDFELNNPNEIINLSYFEGVNNLDDLNLEQNGLDAIINLPNNQKIIFKNTNKDDLSINNFAIVLSNKEQSGELQGTSENDLIHGYGGDDIIDAGAGSDIIKGGQGTDSFIISSDPNSVDEIRDFDINNEKITLKDFANISEFSDLDISYHKNEYDYVPEYFALVNLGDDQFLKIKNAIEANPITANNFIFETLNTAPTATIDISTTLEDNSVVIDVLATASDADGDNLTIESVSQGTNGLVQIIDGKITYTPNENYFGSDSFEYTISDGNGGIVTTTLNVDIVSVNDAPVVLKTSSITSEDSVAIIDVLSEASDVDGDNIVIESVSEGENGSVQIVDGKIHYTPNSNYYGADSFEYTVIDGQGARVTTTLNVIVSSVNDIPTTNIISSTTSEDIVKVIDVLAGSNDADGDDLIISSVTNGENGTTQIIDDKIVYTPNNNYFGQDSFKYTISDGNGGEATTTLNIEIASVNDAPVTTIISSTVNEDSSVTIDVSLGASDIDGDDLFISEVTNPTNGVTQIVDGKIVYTPNNDYFGSDSFEYTVSDGNGGLTKKTLSVTVNPENDNPVATVTSSSTSEDNAVIIDVLAGSSDIDGDNLVINSVTNGNNGLTQIVNGKISYVPDGNYHGTDSFEYTISDGHGGLVTKAVTVTISPVNDAPSVSISDQIQDSQILQSNNFNISFDQNSFVDIDGDTLTYTAKLADGNDLPDWMNFDASSRTFSGNAPSDLNFNINNNQLEIEVTADDGEFSVSQNFVIDIIGNTITGTNNYGSPENIIGTDNNDIIVSEGIDTLTGGLGADTFVINESQSGSEQSVTTITDFDPTDHNEVIDISAFGNITDFDDLEITEGSAIISLNDNQIVRIENITPEDLRASDFVFAENVAPEIIDNNDLNSNFLSENIFLNSITQNQGELPALENIDGQQVNPDSISNHVMTVDQDGEAIVTFKNSVAGYKNAIGWYEIGSNGEMLNPQLLFKNAHSVSSNTEFSLGSLTAGTKIGFFIVADGGSGYFRDVENGGYTHINNMDLSKGGFSFINSSNETATIFDDNSPTLLFTNNVDGKEYTINKHTYHSYNNVNLNPDKKLHGGAGWDSDKGQLLLGFEDLYGGGDKDYNDILFYLRVDGDQNFKQFDYINAPKIDVTLNDANDIQKTILEITNNQEGDSLVFDNNYYIIDEDSGNISKIIDLENDIKEDLGISIKFSADYSNITISGEQTAEIYQNIINSIRFINVSDNENADLNFTRNISIQVTDEDRAVSEMQTKIIIVSDPIIGTSNNDSLNGTDNNDLLIGKAGDDILTGNKGDDILIGGTGSDTYFYNIGDGNDVIDDELVGNHGDILRFGNEILRENIIFNKSLDGKDLIISFKDNKTDSVTIRNQLDGDNSKIETVIFDNGDESIDFTKKTVLSGEDINIQINLDEIEQERIINQNIVIVVAQGLANYNENTGILTYVPKKDWSGIESLTYNIKDNEGNVIRSNNINLLINPINDNPFGSVANLETVVGDNFSLNLLELFSDNEDEDLTLIVNVKNQIGLPDYLNFDEETGILSGAINKNGKTVIEVTASDKEGGIYKTSFNIATNLDLSEAAVDLPEVKVIAGSANSDSLNTVTNQQDLISAGAGDDEITYVQDNVWQDTGNEQFFAWNTYSGDLVSVNGKLQSFDSFDGGTGNDTLNLSSGNDVLFLDDPVTSSLSNSARISGIEIINGGLGDDIIDLSSLNYEYGDVTLNGGDGDDVLWSNSGDDVLNGGDGNDNLQAGSGNDILNGDAGDDILKGYDGDETLTGGTGADTLTGGFGFDSFNFTALNESTINNSDLITDFTQGEDSINFSNLGFTAIQAGEGSGTVLGYSYDQGTDITTIEDANSDFAVMLSGKIDLANDDFNF